MSKPRVFIVQEPMRWNGEEMVPIMDMQPAAEYGHPVVCLTGSKSAMSPVPIVSRLKEVLKNFCDNDYLLAAGDPSAIAIAAAIVSKHNNGKFKLLKWNKNMKQYVQVDINLNPTRMVD